MIHEAMHPTDEMAQCIQNCTDCHQVCVETLNHCIQQGGHYTESVHLRLLLDCAEICQTSVNFMLRGSDLHKHTCGVCAIVCENCVVDCERFTVTAVGSGAPMSKHSGKAAEEPSQADEQMRACAEVCRRCAASCKEMARGH